MKILMRIFDMKKAIILLLSMCLLFGVFASRQALAANSYVSTYFYLYRWNGPMYIDINGYCPSGMEYGVADRYGTDDFSIASGSRNYLNGRVRIWPNKMKANQTYYIMVNCFSPGGHGVQNLYTISYSGNRITGGLYRSGRW